MDADRDGHPAFRCGGDDCADDDASVHPGAADSIESSSWLLEPFRDAASARALRFAVDDAADEVVLFATEAEQPPSDLWLGRRSTDSSWSSTLLFSGGLVRADLSAGPGHPSAVAFIEAEPGDLQYLARLWFARAPSWEPMQLGEVGNALGPISLSQPAVDGTGHASVFVVTDSRGMLYRETEAGFVLESPVDAELIRGADLAVAPDGSVHIAAIIEGDLWHVTDQSGAWAREIVDCVLGMRYPSIAIDGDGNIHVAYVRWTHSELWYANDVAGAFARERVAILGGFTWNTPALAVGADGAAHILFVRGFDLWGRVPPEPVIRYARRAPGGWSSIALAREVTDYALTVSAAGTVRTIFSGAEQDGASVWLGTRDADERVDQDCDGVDGVDADGDGWPDEE